jgi:isopropylmalate/homocitrate/citramalate synthase
VPIRQIECTINGIGERAGNAALVIVMATGPQRSFYWTGVDATMLTRASKLVAAATCSGAVQQGDRRSQRVRARVRHPP